LIGSPINYVNRLIGSPVNCVNRLIGSPINYVNRLIGTPITSQSTDLQDQQGGDGGQEPEAQRPLGSAFDPTHRRDHRCSQVARQGFTILGF
jgi:hypothetical protein